jgi:putative acetyltransferase
MTVHIARLTDEHIPAAREVVTRGCIEFFGHAPIAFEDMAAISAFYAEPSGTFLVLLAGQQVVGTGAIRRLDDQTCELKRLWLLPAYRGRGHGLRMLRQLLDFAIAAGYQRVRLDTAPEMKAANQLYQHLGFYPIERYNDGPAAIFMEKLLKPVKP